MMRADRVYNKAGAPCMDCNRLTFELRRVCPWCAKARQAKIDADASLPAEIVDVPRTGKVWRRPSQDLHGEHARAEVQRKMKAEEAWFGSRESFRVEHADTDVGD
jgi:RNA polymerase subunit RPABC4/transcription elongation factor Spt4